VTVEGKEKVMSELGTLVRIKRGIEDLEIIGEINIQITSNKCMMLSF
jgi:hypothetical protein